MPRHSNPRATSLLRCYNSFEPKSFHKEEVPLSRFALVLRVIFLLLIVSVLPGQQTKTPTQTPPKTPSNAAIPVEATKVPNPVKSSPESLARAKRWWNLDCAMCHGKEGNGQGQTAIDMKLPIADFTDPTTIKDRTDGELFYIIKNGHQDMPPEGSRIKTEENWDLVNYVRSLAKQASDSQTKPSSQ